MADSMAARGDDTDLPASLSSGALDAVSAGVAILDPNGTIVAVNAAWRRFADENGARDPDHFVGWNYLSQCDRVPAASSDKMLASTAQQGLRSVLLAEAANFAQEYPCHAPHRERWMRLKARTIADRSHRFAAVVHEDITERVLAERARNDQLALLAAMFDSALDAIVMINERGTIEAVNPAAGLLFGYEQDKLLGQDVKMLLAPRDRSRHCGLLAEHLQAGSAKAGGIEREVEGQHRNGGSVPLLLRASKARVGDRRVVTAVFHDLTAQKAAAAERLEKERRELIVRELGHRIKNIFATVSSLSQTLARTAGSVTEYRDAMADRLRSLAATQTLLTEGGRQGVMLDELVAFALAAFAADGQIITVDGEQVRLSAEAGQLLGMAIHELATNAAKYGALTSPHGRLAVRWRCAGQATARRLDLVWVERGGPPVSPPERKGFGTTLIVRSLGYELGADVMLDYAVEGLTCRISMPLARVKAGSG